MLNGTVNYECDDITQFPIDRRILLYVEAFPFDYTQKNENRFVIRFSARSQNFERMWEFTYTENIFYAMWTTYMFVSYYKCHLNLKWARWIERMKEKRMKNCDNI